VQLDDTLRSCPGQLGILALGPFRPLGMGNGRRLTLKEMQKRLRRTIYSYHYKQFDGTDCRPFILTLKKVAALLLSLSAHTVG
jgi:hypothetical protein